MQPSTATVFRDTLYCARARVLSDTTLVKVHEGFHATDINSHTDTYKAEFLRQVRVPAERLVGLPISLSPDSLLAAVHLAALAQSHAITDGPTSNPARTGCFF